MIARHEDAYDHLKDADVPVKTAPARVLRERGFHEAGMLPHSESAEGRRRRAERATELIRQAVEGSDMKGNKASPTDLVSLVSAYERQNKLTRDLTDRLDGVVNHLLGHGPSDAKMKGDTAPAAGALDVLRAAVNGQSNTLQTLRKAIYALEGALGVRTDDEQADEEDDSSDHD